MTDGGGRMTVIGLELKEGKRHLYKNEKGFAPANPFSLKNHLYPGLYKFFSA